jgi:hypothetical protein
VICLGMGYNWLVVDNSGPKIKFLHLLPRGGRGYKVMMFFLISVPGPGVSKRVRTGPEEACVCYTHLWDWWS